MSARPISQRQQAEIENVWRDGGRQFAAMKAAGVSRFTAGRVFRALKEAGVPRGRPEPRRHPLDPRLPRYDGPEWIGTRLDGAAALRARNF
jgi:hypothetical protein